ncbi:MAG TPA: hypothetical protein DDY78_07880 [Planctomycetales bacterium]|jgi:acetyl-CoA carboxylase alpha subunit|nr:hypothetical protein [Planctomycetales bacterium]
MNVEEMIAELKKWQPDERDKFLRKVQAMRAEQEFKRRETEYDLQEEQNRKLSRKPRNESDDYGIPDYTP